MVEELTAITPPFAILMTEKLSTIVLEKLEELTSRPSQREISFEQKLLETKQSSKLEELLHSLEQNFFLLIASLKIILLVFTFLIGN
jgi:hypothetical protein